MATSPAIKEEKKRIWADPNEMKKFVNEKCKILCPFCAVPLGDIKVVDPLRPFLQDKLNVTTGDNNGNLNFIFKGPCIHPSQQKPFCPPPPCKGVIMLDQWRDYSDVHINNEFALVRASVIKCLNSMQDILIAHSGQIAEITDFLPYVPKMLIIKKEYYPTASTTVCHKFEYEAEYYEYGDPKEDKYKDIRWKVMIGNKEPVALKELESAKEIITGRAELKGHKIYFPIPQEWRYQTIRMIAYMGNDEEVAEAWSMEIRVKDHIVAAFFRINPTVPKSRQPIERINEAKGTFNLLAEGPVHHHQGMYKDGDLIYVSGSTGWTHSYIYKIRVDEDNKFKHFDTLNLDGKIKKYKHPGGLQVANGILAVGIEEYQILGMNTKKNSVICFFETGEYKELANLRIPVKDFASAVGIVYHEDKWIVASRGGGKAVNFYAFNDNDIKNNSEPLISIEVKNNVAEFQNLNLFLDENEDVYMFGMGKGKMGGVDICKIYKVTIVEEKSKSEIKKLEAVWIDDNGYIDFKNYEGFDNNKLIFACQDKTSFHWASCVELQRNEKTGVLELDNVRKGAPDFIGDDGTGFLGKFTVYTVEGVVSYDRIDVASDEENQNKYLEYQDYLYDLERQGEKVDWEKEQIELNDILHQRIYIYVNPKISCNSFMED